MNVYVDTNLIVARTVADHPHRPHAIRLFRQIASRRWTPAISSHGLAEVYSVLTRAPFARPISPAEAWRMIQENILARFEIESLSRTDYASILQACASNGWSGGLVYDAIHVHAARKANCARIFTMDVEHFRRIAPDLRNRILSP